MTRQRGFTLLEVLVAVSITALIGMGAAQLLGSVVDVRRATDIRTEQLASLQRFNMIVSRDIEQIINRSIRDRYGDTQPALLLDGDAYALEFTRTGWRNSPFNTDPRSELQRVAYRLESLDSDLCEPARVRLESWGVTDIRGECLVRYFWLVLDQASTSEPVAQVVLEQADTLEIDLLATAQSVTGGDEAGDWFSAWPALDAQAALHPRAMRWRLQLPQLGTIERLWLLPWGDES